MIRDGSEPTHRLVTRRPADADVAGSDAPGSDADVAASDTPDGVGRIGVENLAVGVAMEYGSAVHLSIAASTVDRMVPEEHRAAFERVEDENGGAEAGRRRLTDGTEYRVSLPDGREAVTALLSVDPTDTDQWRGRLFDLEEFAVVTPDSWLYRSVPHHSHIRQVNAAGEPAYLTALREELAAVPETGVFPAGPLVAWEGRECRYELQPTTFQWRSGGESWTALDLERLREVHPQRERVEILLHWDSPDTVLGAFERVADELGYDYAVRTENQSGSRGR